MIYITGDTHIPHDIQKLATKKFPEQKEMSKDDYVIICGDFGGVWNNSNEEKYWIRWLENKNFSTLFIDGNHENFDMLYSLPEVTFGGGTAHKVGKGIYHLMRGEIYFLDGRKLFVFGGAASHDKKFRTEGKTWWKEELPNKREYKNAENNLKKHDFSVDCIITHCAPASVQKGVAPSYEENSLTSFLDEIKCSVSYQKWFFGHYHKDAEIGNGFYAIFDKIIKLW